MIVKNLGPNNLRFKFFFVRYIDQIDESSFTVYNQSIVTPFTKSVKEGEVECHLVASAFNFTKAGQNESKTRVSFFSEILWNLGISDKKVQGFFSSYYFSMLSEIQKSGVTIVQRNI